MNLKKNQIEIIKNTKSLEELKQKVKDNSLSFDDELIEETFNLYHSNQLSDDELDNVTGGCGYPVITDSSVTGCDDYMSMHENKVINKQQSIEIFGESSTRCIYCLNNKYNEEKQVRECQKSIFESTYGDLPRY